MFKYTDDLINNISGRVIVIGNGIFKKKYGEVINNYDNVIRINEYVISNYEEYIGTKTTYWFFSGNFTFVKVNNDMKLNIVYCLFTKSSIEVDPNIRQSGVNVIYSKIHPKTILNIKRPTTGGAILALFHYYNKKADAIGFDFFKSKHYWNPNDKNYNPSVHNTSKNIEEHFLRNSKYINFIG